MNWLRKLGFNANNQKASDPSKPVTEQCSAAIQLSAVDMVQARSILQMMKQDARSSGGREEWATCALEIARRVTRSDLQAARSLLAEVKEVALQHSEPELALHWTNAVVPAIESLGKTDFAAARSLLTEMRTVADSFPDHPLLRERWHIVARTLANEVATTDQLLADSLRHELDDGLFRGSSRSAS